MGYKSNLNEVLNALSKSKKEICNGIGNFATSEAQLREPVVSGNMRRSTTFEVLPDNAGVDFGVTDAAPYAIWVHEGSSKNNNPQPFLKDAIMDNISKFEEIAGQIIKANMSGD